MGHQQLNIFGKQEISWGYGWERFEVDSLEGIRYANYDEIPECKNCEMDCQPHPLVYAGDGSWDLLCSLDFIMHPVTKKSVKMRQAK